MQIEQLSKDLDFALNKENLFFSHEEKMNALHRAQIELFAFYHGNPAGYQNGRPVPRVAYQVTKTVSEALRPFLKTYDYFDLVNGFVTAPEDMAQATALRTTLGREIKLVDDDKVAGKLQSKVCPVNEDYPIAEIDKNGWKVYPSLTALHLKYLSVPIKPVYATTIVNGEEVFDSVNSVDVEWSEMQHNELINRTLAILGLNVKDAVVMNISERAKQQGQ